MPWTFSHPAAVVPLRRVCPRYLHFAAVVGSITPDAGYYVRRFDLATIAHTARGSVELCVPTGIVILVAFYLVRKQWCFVLPSPHREALLPLSLGPWPRGLADSLRVLVSLLLGAWSHLAWDAFTHPAAGSCNVASGCEG